MGDRSEVGSFREHRVVDSVDDWSRGEGATTEVATVETLKSIVTTLDVSELDVDLALVAVAEEGEVNNFSVLGIALALEVRLKVCNPVGVSLPVEKSVHKPRIRNATTYSASL